MNEPTTRSTRTDVAALALWCASVFAFEGISIFVLPAYGKVFSDVGVELPTVTVLALSIARLFRSFSLVTVPLGGLVIVGSLLAFRRSQSRRLASVFRALAILGVAACLATWMSVYLSVVKIQRALEKDGPPASVPK